MGCKWLSATALLDSLLIISAQIFRTEQKAIQDARREFQRENFSAYNGDS